MFYKLAKSCVFWTYSDPYREQYIIAVKHDNFYNGGNTLLAIVSSD